MTHEDIDGWFDFEDIYQQRIDEAKDGDVFVEVGVWLGKSTAFMAQGIRDSGKQIQFFAIDWWKPTIPYPYENAYQIFLANMIRCNVSQWVKPIHLRSVEASSFFRNQSINFLFLDADHSYDEVRDDISVWLPKIKPGGIFAGHDYTNFPGVTQAVDEAFPEAEIIKASWLHRVAT